MTMRLRALRRLLRELVAFAHERDAWWVYGVGLLVVVTLAISTTSSVAVPTAVYAFF